jgi:hypothetical protein
VRTIPTTSAIIAATVLAAATMLTLIWLVAGYGRLGDLATGLDAGLVGGVVLALLSLAFWPNMAAFGVAYLAGPGFAVGTDTAIAPGAVRLGAVPSLPLLGIVPQSAPAGGVWLATIAVASAAVGAVWMVRRLPGSLPWWAMAASALAASLTAAAGLALVVAAASGSAGPGRMAEVGAGFWPVFAALALELAGGCVPVIVIARAQVARRVHAATHRPIKVTGQGAADLSEAVGSASGVTTKAQVTGQLRPGLSEAPQPPGS